MERHGRSNASPFAGRRRPSRLCWRAEDPLRKPITLHVISTIKKVATREILLGS